MPLNIIIDGTVIAAQCLGIAFVLTCLAIGLSVAAIKLFHLADLE